MMVKRRESPGRPVKPRDESGRRGTRGRQLLRIHLRESGKTHRAFAEAINVLPVTVSRYSAGTSVPDLETAFRIEDATAGAVPARAWTQPPDPRLRKAAE